MGLIRGFISKSAFVLGQLVGLSSNVVVKVQKLSAAVPAFIQQTYILIGFVNFTIYLLQQTSPNKKIVPSKKVAQKFARLLPPEVVEDFVNMISANAYLPTEEIHKLFIFLRKHLVESNKMELLKLMIFFSQEDNVVKDEEIEILKLLAADLFEDLESFEAIFEQLSSSITIIDKESLYAVLGVNKSASDKEIHKAYIKMAAKFHPDRFMQQSHSSQKEAHDRFLKVSQAYQQLKC